MSNCAYCQAKGCYKDDFSNVPSDCPSILTSHEEILAGYSEEEKKAIPLVALVYAEGARMTNRIEETMDYAYKMGYKKIGVAFCSGLAKEGEALCKVLKSNGFFTQSICCKYGGVHKSEYGISADQQVNPSAEQEICCNPAGQAQVLDAAGVDFVIMLGLCVGHDTIFIKHLKAPMTVIGVKDRLLIHNPVAALQSADKYMVRMHSFIENKYGKTAWE